MVKSVTTIPARINKKTAMPIDSPRKRRVAAYARVSTDSEEQATSYEAQVDYYTNYIKSRNDWEFVRVYADEGITGTSTKDRVEFKAMINDALDGKIDLIITKSVSRFARNTVDTLTTVRKLKEKNIEVWFEKENIQTLDSKGELLITIMSSLAQEESRSISENCTWGQRKRFADGKVTVPFSRFLGYDRGEDGNLVVNPEEAKSVKLLYGLFLEGRSCYGVAKELTSRGIKTPGGKDKWSAQSVRSILTNEKYKGDALLQKSFTVDFLTKKKKINEGEIPQYYVKNNHEAIIEPETWDFVQTLLEHDYRKSKNGVTIFSGKLKCEDCGDWYGSKVWHSNSKYKRTIWQCNSKFKKKCQTPHFTEDEIKDAFMKAVSILIKDREQIQANFQAIESIAYSTKELEIERDKLYAEMESISQLMEQAIQNNARVALDQEKYNREFDEMAERFNSVKEKYDAINEKIEDKKIRHIQAGRFIKTLLTEDETTTFSPLLWQSLFDYAKVSRDGKITFVFRNGMEI
jgi:site-specific DNA recombinase